MYSKTSKDVVVSLVLLTTLCFSSCEKKDVEPTKLVIPEWAKVRIEAELKLFDQIEVSVFKDDGDEKVIEHGIVWALNPEPTLADNKITEPSQADTYQISMDNLPQGSRYFIRGFLRTEKEERYSNEVSFPIVMKSALSVSPLIAGAGMSLTIKGVNLDSGIVVYVNDVQVSKRISNDSAITVNMPVLTHIDSATVSLEVAGFKIPIDKKIKRLRGKWDPKPTLNGSFKYGIDASDGTKGYVKGVGDTVIFTFDPLKNVWSKLTPPSYDISHSRLFIVDSIVYVPAGVNENRNFLAYDTRTDEWTKLPDCGFNIATLSAATYSYNGKGYTAFFIGSSSRTRKYDPLTGSWTSLSSFPGEEPDFVKTIITDSGVYFIAGQINKPTIYVWFYMPEQDTWERKADYPGKPGLMSGFSINNRIYAGCGDGGKDFWEYDPTTNKWDRVNNYPGPTPAFSFSIQNSGYIGAPARDPKANYQTWSYSETD